MLLGTWRENVKRMKSGYFQRCPAEKQEAMGIYWNTGGSLLTLGNTSVLSSTGKSCPDVLWSLLLIDLQKPLDHGPEQLVLSDPTWAGVGSDGLQRSQRTSDILWFFKTVLSSFPSLCLPSILLFYAFWFLLRRNFSMCHSPPGAFLYAQKYIKRTLKMCQRLKIVSTNTACTVLIWSLVYMMQLLIFSTEPLSHSTYKMDRAYRTSNYTISHLSSFKAYN